MSIYHMSAKVIGRSSGRSSVAAAAYRSGEALVDERQGLSYDYTKKQGVEHTEIMLPDNAPAEYTDRQTLWNAVEKAEKDSKAQLAREIELALPVELTQRKQLEVLHEYVQATFVDNGMIADIALHDKGDGNPHAHIMLTMRPLDEAGKWQQKNEKVYLCKNAVGQEQGFTARELRQAGDEWEKQLPYFKNGKGRPVYLTKHQAETERKYRNHVRMPGKKNPKTSKEHRVNPTLEQWNDSNNVEIWRAQWARVCNHALEQEGITERLDHRSYERQGKEQLPTIHMGASATQLEMKGYRTERGQYNEDVKALNRQLKALSDKIEEMKQKRDEAGLNLQHMTAEQLIASINKLSNSHRQLEIQKQRIQKATNMLSQKANAIRFQLRDLNDRMKTINELDSNMQQLKSKKAGLGIFARKAKRAISENIKHLEESKGYCLQSMKNNYTTTPDKVSEAMNQLRKELALVIRQRNDIADIQPLIEQQEEINRRYKEYITAALQHPESRKILEFIDAPAHTPGRAQPIRQKNLAELAQEGKEEADRMYAELLKERSEKLDISRDDMER